MNDVSRMVVRNLLGLFSPLAIFVVAGSGCSSHDEPPVSEFTGSGGAQQGTGGAGGSSSAAGQSGTGLGFGWDAAVVQDAAVMTNDSGNDAGCGQTKIQASGATVLLVIDRSGSMSQTPPNFSADKWTAMKSALATALEPFKADLALGLELFPNNLDTPIPSACTSQCWDLPAGEAAIVVPIGVGRRRSRSFSTS